MPWPEPAKAAFLRDQFELQHRHFTAHFPDADFLVVERDGRAAGRLYVDWRTPEALIIDVGILPEHRGSGLGRALLQWAERQAAARGCERLGLSVLMTNPRARKLYERLGFVGGLTSGPHLRMAKTLARPTVS